MHVELVARVARLTDGELLHNAALLAERERGTTVELVGHLAELDARKLHVAEGYGSLFAYCTGPLRLAEHAAYNRIEAARLSRRFPAVLDLVSDGSLNLSTLRLLAPHVTPENFDALVAQARHRSKREVEALVAELAPRPDVPASVRRLPARGPTLPTAKVQEPAEQDQRPTTEPRDARPQAVELAPAVPRPADRPVVAPLAPGRFRAQFTMSAATHAKLRQAQELLRREIPDGDPGAIFDRALTLLLEDVARRKARLTPMPGPSRPASAGSRHIPAHVKRTVWLRDAGQCAFASMRGKRCDERAFLEFHHQEPYAVGGEAMVANISLRCRAHNAYEAELAFGSMASRSRARPGGDDARDVGSVAYRARG